MASPNVGGFGQPMSNVTSPLFSAPAGVRAAVAAQPSCRVRTHVCPRTPGHGHLTAQPPARGPSVLASWRLLREGAFTAAFETVFQGAHTWGQGGRGQGRTHTGDGGRAVRISVPFASRPTCPRAFRPRSCGRPAGVGASARPSLARPACPSPQGRRLLTSPRRSPLAWAPFSVAATTVSNWSPEMGLELARRLPVSPDACRPPAGPSASVVVQQRPRRQW